MSERIKEWIKAIVSATVVAIIIIQFIMPTIVFGVSMEPNFESDDFLLVNKQAYAGKRTPQRGDIIVFRSTLKDENEDNKKLIKRVIAVPGDIVAVADGQVYINGKELRESYIKDGLTDGDILPQTVPEGTVFCMGDNRLHSTDSRSKEVGFVSEDVILGKVFLRVYPFNKFGVIGSD